MTTMCFFFFFCKKKNEIIDYFYVMDQMRYKSKWLRIFIYLFIFWIGFLLNNYVHLLFGLVLFLFWFWFWFWFFSFFFSFFFILIFIVIIKLFWGEGVWGLCLEDKIIFGVILRPQRFHNKIYATSCYW